jgi:uncharacterized lipoprotein YmbA
MKTPALLTAVASLALAGCASTNGTVQNTSQAEMTCRSFVTVEGLGVAQMGKAETADGGFRVPVRVEDRLGRRIDNACIISNNQARWASPLPSGVALR